MSYPPPQGAVGAGADADALRRALGLPSVDAGAMAGFSSLSHLQQQTPAQGGWTPAQGAAMTMAGGGGGFHSALPGGAHSTLGNADAAIAHAILGNASASANAAAYAPAPGMLHGMTAGGQGTPSSGGGNSGVGGEEHDQQEAEEEEGEGEEEYEDDEGGDVPPDAVVSAGGTYYDDGDAGHDTESYASGDEEDEEGGEDDDDDDEGEEEQLLENVAGMMAVKTEVKTEGGDAAATPPVPAAAAAALGGTNKADRMWLQRLGELHQYKAEHGDAMVPQKYDRNKGLGEWVHRQRVQYRNLTQGKPSNLTPERIRALHDVGFAFVARGGGAGTGRATSPKPNRRASPAPSVGSAAASAASSGVVDLTGDEDGHTPSGGPAPRRRAPATARGKGRKTAAKPQTAATSRNQDTWNLRLEQLREYHAEHGDFAVPRKYEPNPKLGYWVKAQREQILLWVRGQSSALTGERMGALFEMGFPLPRVSTNPNPMLNSPVTVAGAGAGDIWNVRINELRKYRLENGDYAVPRKYEKNPKLGYWVKAVREQFCSFFRGKKSTLTQPRMRALYQIGFPFTVPKRAGVPKTGTKTQHGGRQSAKGSRQPVMVQPKVEADINCPVATPTPKTAGNTGNDATNKAVDAAGIGVPSPQINYTPESSALVSPPGRQITGSVGRVTGEESGKSRATAAGSSKQDTWEQRFEELQRFREENGHCLVPQKYDLNRKLGLWVSQQRTQYRYWINGDTSSLSREKIRALKELGFAWNGRASGSTDAIVGKAGTKRALATPGATSEKRGRTTQEGMNNGAPTAFVSPLSSVSHSHTSSCSAESTKQFEEEQGKLHKEMEDIKAQLVAAQSELGETRAENERMRNQLLDIKKSLSGVISTLS